jgi:hypothetical protein
MKTNLAHVIYLSIVLLGISAVLILGGEKTITGRAASEAVGSQESLGNYSILPHFTVQANFSLDKYKELRIDARKLVDEVSKCDGEPEQCIGSSLRDLGLVDKGWLYKCGYSKERLFYDLAEFYQDCRDSPDTACVCRLDLDKPYPDGTYEIAIRPFAPDTIIESQDMQSIDISGAEAKVLQYGGGLENYINRGDQIISLSYKKSIQSSDITVSDSKFNLRGQLVFYKYGKDLATVLSEDYSKIDSRLVCTITPKRMAYFCVVSDEKVTAYDASDRQTRLRNLVYKFALYFPEQLDEIVLH